MSCCGFSTSATSVLMSEIHLLHSVNKTHSQLLSLKCLHLQQLVQLPNLNLLSVGPFTPRLSPSLCLPFTPSLSQLLLWPFALCFICLICFPPLSLALFISLLPLFYFYCSLCSVPDHLPFSSSSFSSLSLSSHSKHTHISSPPLPSEEVLLFPGRLGGLWVEREVGRERKIERVHMPGSW